MSSKNTEGTLLSALGDWLHCTKEKGSETFTPCSIRDRCRRKKQKLENYKEELYELYLREKY